MSIKITKESLKILQAKVHACARDGMAISIFAMLWNLDKTVVHDALSHITEENEQKTTPLIIAARNGAVKVVAILLTQFNVDIEQTGTVKFDGFVIHKATALWCAAGAGHFETVKYLIQKGADVNHPTQTNSTPLRAACFDGRLDIVKYLIEHKADITIPNKYKNTCLMISSYKGHIDVVQILLEKGADPNITAHCGATALHFAADCGHTNIVKKLIKFGAKNLENNNKMTPLLVAAESGKPDVVAVMLSLHYCTKEEKIDALELLGAFYANDKVEYNIAKAIQYLEEAMHVRYSDKNNIILKKFYPPVAAYENIKECQTVEDVQKLKGDSHALHMQSLAIRERILGPDNPDLLHALVYRGAVYADSALFEKCINLWYHALMLRQKSGTSVCKDLLRFAQVFSQMLRVGVALDIKTVIKVFESAIKELKYDITKNRELEDDPLTCVCEIYQLNIHTCLYLIVIALESDHVKSDLEELKKFVYLFIKLDPRLDNNYSPLHMAVDSATIVDDFHVEEVVSFPNGPLTEIFLQCGACPNALDSQQNTPLHIIARYINPLAPIDNVQCLIKNGAHLDMCNAERKAPFQCCLTEEAKTLLQNITRSRISLKCIAAQCIQKHKIPFKGLVPDFLEEFIDIH